MNDNDFLKAELESLKNIPKVADVTPALRKAAEALKGNPRHEADLLRANFVALIQATMDEEGLSKSALGERMHKSRQYIGRILNETANFTIESMVELCTALGLELEISVKKSEMTAQKGNIENSSHTPVRISRKTKRMSDVA